MTGKDFYIPDEWFRGECESASIVVVRQNGKRHQSSHGAGRRVQGLHTQRI